MHAQWAIHHGYVGRPFRTNRVAEKQPLAARLSPGKCSAVGSCATFRHASVDGVEKVRMNL
jgi:hypothetical protein